MGLLLAFVFCAILLGSNAQSPPPVASADCNGTEKDAGLALDLINQHRKEGYVFSLLRVVDAHVQHIGDASMFYFTLDVLETDCPVISRKHWETCGYKPIFGTSDFGRCNAVIYINPAFQSERLYGYNCTMSPVPPNLYQCKECPEKIIALEKVQQFTEDAERILALYNRDNNETNHFKVDRILKVLLGEAPSVTVHHVEFTIQKTMCPTSKLLSLVSGCKFPDREAHAGFCVGKVLSGTKGLEGVEAESCEIYDVQPGRHPVHSHPHNDSGEYHRHCNVSGHGCRGPGHRHHHPHHHPPPHHHHHRRPHHHHRRPHHHHHHRPHDHHRHRHSHGHPPCFSAGTISHSNSSKESQGKDYPGFPPPRGPDYPPPPPGGPHHFPPAQFPPPPFGPPPPPGYPFWPPPHHHHHHHHHDPEGPYLHPPPPPPCGPRHGYHHDHQRNYTLHGRKEDASSKGHDWFQSPHSFFKHMVASIYRIPVASQLDVLQAPGADFFSPSHKKAVTQPFPLTPSESESCPGAPTLDLSFDLLSLYPRAH